MGVNRDVLTQLKDEFGKRPVMSNVAFGFIMAGVEKMLEVEFACPCNPTWNAVFVSPFFLIPAFTSSGLMMLLHGCKGYENVLCSLLPLVVWLALMLLDGQYVVCAKTDWPGTFVSTEGTYLKWCIPTNQTPSVQEELMNRSHRFYILSQGCGNAIVAFILLALIVYVGCTRCKANKCAICGCPGGQAHKHQSDKQKSEGNKDATDKKKPEPCAICGCPGEQAHKLQKSDDPKPEGNEDTTKKKRPETCAPCECHGNEGVPMLPVEKTSAINEDLV